jgi:hypothetical protein
MAAAARAPGPADARTPCPLCGGLIHPIAGRCKHCKGDLSALRSARPAAAAALPALQAAPAPPAPTVPDPYAIAHAHSNGHGNGHGHARAGYQAQPNVPLPVQVAHAAAAFAQVDAVHAILPPRPTGRMPVTAARSIWKSWQVIVIVLAVIAIVTAVVLMVWPPNRNPDPGAPGAVQPMPAPERMDTNPSPSTPPPSAPSSSNDPWSNRGASPPGHQPAPDVDDPGLANPNDPFSRRGGNRAGSLGSLGSGGTFMIAMMSHACERFSQCGTIDRVFKATCDVYARQLPRAAPPSCDAAQRCLDHIDALDCDASMNDTAALARLMTQFSDCVEALSC